MEQLSAKLKNAPRDTSLVPCSANSCLNSSEKVRNSDLSGQNLGSGGLTDNNPEENQLQHRGGSDLSSPERKSMQVEAPMDSSSLL